jgi:hypothetical protein
VGVEALLVFFLSDVMEGAEREKIYHPKTSNNLGMEAFRISDVLHTNSVA